ncbi:hypothetical protein TCAL_15641, partial [Tigriopus californicus]
MEALESLEGPKRCLRILATHPTHDRRREYLETLVPEALKRREQSGCAQLKDTNVAFQDYWRRFRSLRPAAGDTDSGNIFVFTGMLDMCETDGQLGFVLSHEIAHTLLNHAGEKISHVNFVYMWVLVPLALLWAVLPNDGIALIADWFFNKVIEIVFELPFSREMEREADEVGLTMAAKACFDVRQASLFWGKMEALESLEGHEKMPEILATHPTHDRRREYLETLVPEALKRREQSGCAQLKDTNVAFQDYWRRFRSLRPA